MRHFFQNVVDQMYAAGTGGATRRAQALVLAAPPNIDLGEITDKGLDQPARRCSPTGAALVDARFAPAAIRRSLLPLLKEPGPIPANPVARRWRVTPLCPDHENRRTSGHRHRRRIRPRRPPRRANWRVAAPGRDPGPQRRRRSRSPPAIGAGAIGIECDITSAEARPGPRHGRAARNRPGAAADEHRRHRHGQAHRRQGRRAGAAGGLPPRRRGQPRRHQRDPRWRRPRWSSSSRSPTASAASSSARPRSRPSTARSGGGLPASQGGVVSMTLPRRQPVAVRRARVHDRAGPVPDPLMASCRSRCRTRSRRASRPQAPGQARGSLPTWRRASSRTSPTQRRSDPPGRCAAHGATLKRRTSVSPTRSISTQRDIPP